MTRSGRAPGQTPWWKDAVAYQIYPRSFNDSDGDGIGDLNGITDRLGHLHALGIDLVWLSPHFDSPNVDNGYDIRDYRKIMRELGSTADFDRMLSRMTELGIALVIDLVVNHTSDQHRWFIDSRSAKDSRYRDHYIWRDGRPDGGPPNNYPSFFGGSAWQFDASTGQYYLHYFAAEQPDLDWDNAAVREDVFDLMRFWLDKGVAGFRMDVIPFISKQERLPDLLPGELDHPERVYASGPRVHDYLRLMRDEVLRPVDAVAIGEAFGVDLDQAAGFVDARRGELDMLFHFDIVRIDRDRWRKTSWTLPQLKAAYARIDVAAGEHGWSATFLCNHDNPRAVSHFGNDSAEWRALSAKALATVMLTQRATPFIYQGDELGMTNFPFERIEQYDDVEARGLWRAEVESGRVDAGEFLMHLRQTSRDHARTPMQWTGADGGGFSTGRPWLAMHPDHVDINAEEQLGDPASVLHHYRRLIVLRKRMPVLVHGRYEDIDPAHPHVFAYVRRLDTSRCLVLVNFSLATIEYALPAGTAIDDTLVDNGAGTTAGKGATHVTLAPWQATVYRCI